MNLIKTKIEDLLILEPRVFDDGRGYFFESYNKKKLEDLIRKISLELSFWRKSCLRIL